jgi:hypothetical protein
MNFFSREKRYDASELEASYQRGLAEGNAAAVGLLVGCPDPIVLIEDPDVPRGRCELRVRDVSHMRLPSIYLNLLRIDDRDEEAEGA